MADPGEGSGGPSPPLFLAQTEARRAWKKFWWPHPPPPPPFLRVWMTAPHPLSQGLDLALSRVHKNAKLGVFYTKSFEMTPVRLGRESLWLKQPTLKNYSLVYRKRLNYNNDQSNNDHHGFESFEVSGLSHEAVATSCFQHDRYMCQNHALR